MYAYICLHLFIYIFCQRDVICVACAFTCASYRTCMHVNLPYQPYPFLCVTTFLPDSMTQCADAAVFCQIYVCAIRCVYVYHAHASVCHDSCICVP